MGPGGITTSLGAKIPTLAGAGTLFPSTIFLMVKTGYSEKTKAILFFNKSYMFSNSGMGCPPNFLKASYSYPSGSLAILKETAFLITEFFPITKTPPYLEISLLTYYT